MREFRCELLSAEQLTALASGPLPSGVAAGAPIRSLHRDVYLDSADDSLRRRGVTCRLRTGVDGKAMLTLRLNGAHGGTSARFDAPVDATTPSDALAGSNVVARRLRGIIDPRLLDVRIELEVDRITRTALPDWLRRPRLQMHLDRITVRRNGRSAGFLQMCAHQPRGSDDVLTALERALDADLGVRRSSVATHERAELAVKWARLEDIGRDAPRPDREHSDARVASHGNVAELLNAELSLLAFQLRVLSLADDPKTPLSDRLRFLAIVGANVDEFFMVRMAGLMAAAQLDPTAVGDDGLTLRDELEAIRAMVRTIGERQARCLGACLEALSARGVRLLRWEELTQPQRDTLRERYRTEVQPLLTPFAMTLSPGHPLPRLRHLTLSMALVLRPRAGGPPKFAELDLPADVPRFLSCDDGRSLVAVENVVAANLGTLYPDMDVEQSHVFRVTRSAELELDELGADDLLIEVARATATRGQGAAVRLEVERRMPPMLRALLLEDVRREQAEAGGLAITDVDEVDGMIDMRALSEIDLSWDAASMHPPIASRAPFDGAASVFDRIAAASVLAHHPFDSFADSVGRFLRAAATDPAVAAIKITLYRIGSASPVAQALVDAARAGKSVTVFIELKARFDEDVNVSWARALEAAGGHVVRGIVGYKNHAKAALIIRREGDRLVRYAHIGTGNYNARSGEQYTDLSLFTTDPTIVDDVGELFNELTGASEPPRGMKRAIMTAPAHLLPGILDLIERESAHARAGRPANISLKINGLSDPDVVKALYRASGDGVRVDLVVRGICTLRPGTPGLSDRIRVVSVVGRFLEHSRIYRFANGGSPQHFIGSADLRPRNLRRRVELLAPVVDGEHRAMLDSILALYLSDPTAWELQSDGSYRQGSGGGASAQEQLIPR